MNWQIAVAPMLVALCLSSPAVACQPSAEALELADRAKAQVESYALHGDGASIREIAHPQFMTVFAPGLLESLSMVSETAGNVQVTRFDQETLDARIVGDTAVIITRADVAGTVGGRPFPTPILMTHTFARENKSWLLLQRTMTPITVPEEVFRRVLARALSSR